MGELSVVVGVDALLTCAHESDHILLGLYAQKLLSLTLHDRQPVQRV